MPTLTATPSKGKDLGLLVLAVAATAVGWGTLLPAVVALALVWRGWGRPLGVAGVLLAALTLAAFAGRAGPADGARKALGAAPASTAPPRSRT